VNRIEVAGALYGAGLFIRDAIVTPLLLPIIRDVRTWWPRRRAGGD
jgi:hypothetical protein